MSYESRLLVVNLETYAIDNEIHQYADIIADLLLGEIGADFQDLFTKKVDFKLYNIANEDLHQDKYNQPLFMSEIQPVIKWLEHRCQIDDYRRLKPTLALLKAIELSQWEKIVIVHYGY